MKLNFTANKEEPFNLNDLAFKKIQAIDNNQIIPFRKITQILGVNFHLSREQTFQLLREWEEKNLIEIHPFNGVEILK